MVPWKETTMKRQKVRQLTRAIYTLVGSTLVLLTSPSTPAFGQTDTNFGEVAFVDLSGGHFSQDADRHGYSRDFGAVAVNQCSPVDFDFFEIRHDPPGETHKLRVSSLDVVGDAAGDFKVTTASAAVGDWFNGNIGIKVRFCPTQAGVRKATIRLTMWHIRVDQQGTDFVKNVPEFHLIGMGTKVDPPPPNSSPALISGWNAIAFGEAIGGFYFSTGNLRVGVDSQAIWEGTLPAGRRPYRVEVFIPRQPLPGKPRTDHAEYLIFPDGPLGQVLTSISQNVSTSQWVDLGTWPFDSKYRVVLTDETGETTLTRSIVANAVRLTPQ
jgi:hypothetical protein